MKRIILVVAILMIPLCAIALDEPDIICAQPGDSGFDVKIVLDKCRENGFLANAPSSEETYHDSYIDAVKALEDKMGLTVDGIIYLSEFVDIEGALFEGCTSESFKKIVEKLRDLGYFSGQLPEKHNTWEKKYTDGIKKAEKALKLKPDGILTYSEITTILSQHVDIPSPIKNLKASSSGGKVNLSWNASKGAFFYRIYRDSEMVQLVYGKTTWQDTEVYQGCTYSYKIQACKYTASSVLSAEESVYVNPVYKSTNLKELNEKPAQYSETFVKLGNMRVSRWYWSGKDLMLDVYTKSGNNTYSAVLILEDYDGWTGARIYNYKLKTVNGSGFVTYTGGQPNITMLKINYNY